MTEKRTKIARPFQRLSLSNLGFQKKLLLLPGVALVAFVAILFMLIYFSGVNQDNLGKIQTQYIPTLEASRDLEDYLEKIQQGLQDAAAAEDIEVLQQTDAHRDAFLESLGKLEEAGVRSASEVRGLRETFTGYYTLARSTTEVMISGAMTDSLVQRLRELTERYNEIKGTLEDGTSQDRVDMTNAFRSASDANRQAMWANVGITLIFIVLMGTLAYRISRIATNQLRLVGEGFERMGQGDFSKPVPITVQDELGELGEQVNATSGYLADLVREIRQMAAEVNSAAAEMSATANQHQQGATEQSSAVDETQRTMQSILASTEQINQAIDMVLRNAEQTQTKNQLIGESIVSLSAHTDRITEVLSTIKDIANKAELLALNAALEGTKAGEVGRGFSLVATQMQRLAENVQHAVGNIRTLTENIRRATSSSVLATEEGTKLASDTTRSAREIRLVIQQHQTGTQQVSRAMDDVAQVAQQSAASSRQILASSEDLTAFSERLLSMTDRFRLAEEVNPSTPAKG